ncbi:MAG: flagellin [Euryarchaeota archaeon]|nr:flagellin [Euryarchaeota archaeon]
MSSESFTTAIFLITAVIAAAVLVNAFFPIIYTATTTFTSTSHTADERLRTDIKIVNSYASSVPDPNIAKIWIKNVGTTRIADTKLNKSDVYIGAPGDFEFAILTPGGSESDPSEWEYDIIDIDSANGYWDQGETLYIEARSSEIPGNGEDVYFQFVLPGGIVCTTTFTSSG